jgi:hypothetical protein
VWVSQVLAGNVVRIDAESGDVLATIDIGTRPLKIQEADGRMWVRAADAYHAIDPSTNTITATLNKADVGPQANRSWAVDGALWICDGRRVHRYDPTTLESVAVIDVDVDCGQVYATDDLVVAWNYNEDEGESGVSAAAFIDPATNAVVATVDLPVDVGVPVVLDESVFFSGAGGSLAAVVDRTKWEVVATPDLGRSTGRSQNAFDGRYIYVPTYEDPFPDILIVDAATFEVVDSFEPVGVNSVEVLDDWLFAIGDVNLLQRFDLPQ